MSELRVNDWLSYNKLIGQESSYPIFLSKLLYSELIEWTDAHYQSNKSLTIAGHYQQNPTAAQNKRLNEFIESFNETITYMKSLNKNPPFTYGINGLTPNGRLQRLIYILAVSDSRNSYILISDNPNPLI